MKDMFVLFNVTWESSSDPGIVRWCKKPQIVVFIHLGYMFSCACSCSMGLL